MIPVFETFRNDRPNYHSIESIRILLSNRRLHPSLFVADHRDTWNVHESETALFTRDRLCSSSASPEPARIAAEVEHALQFITPQKSVLQRFFLPGEKVDRTVLEQVQSVENSIDGRLQSDWGDDSEDQIKLLFPVSYPNPFFVHNRCIEKKIRLDDCY